MRNSKVERDFQSEFLAKSSFGFFRSIKQFYINHMVKVIRPINLSKNISILIVIINSLTLLSFVTKNDNNISPGQVLTMQQRRVYDVSNFIKYLQVIPLLNDYFTPSLHSYGISLIIISFALNTSYILVIAFDYTFSERNVFGLNSNGFVIPLSLRIKIQLLENDFGVCALIQKQKISFSYIFFDDEGRITDLSKKDLIHQPTQQVQSLSQNIQEISFNNISSQQYLNKFNIGNNSNIIQSKPLNLINCLENPILEDLNSFVQSFLKIDDAQYCFIDVMNLVGLNNYQSVLGYNQYLIIDSLDLQNYEYNQTDFQEQGVLQDYNINLQKLVLDNDSSDQLFELQKNMFQVQIYAAGFYNNARVQQNSTTTFEQSLQYTLMEFFYEITFYYINYEEQQEDFIWGNIYNFKQRMKNLQLIVENYAKDQFNNMNLYQIFAIILFATISAVLIFSIVPLNIMIQIQKEKILKLFGTFSPAAIELQIKQIELSLYKMEQISIKEQTKSFTIAKRSDDFTGLNNKQNNFQKQLTFQKVQNYQYLNNLQGNNSLNLNQNDFINKIKSKDWPQKVRTGNRKKYWREKEEHKEEQYNEIASVNSSKYSTEEIMKRKMIKKIKKMELTSRLKLMVFTGVAAFLILSFVSSIIYIQNTNSLNSFVRSFLKVDDGIFCFIDIMNFISLKKYEVILQQNQSLIIDNLDLQKYEQNLAYHQQNEVLQDYKSNLQKLVLVNYNKDQLYQLQNNLFQVHIYGAKTENYNQDQQDSITTYELSLQYTLMELLQQITFYYLNQGDSQEDFIWGNIYSFKQRMKDLQLIVQDNAKRQFNNMDTQNNCSSIALNNASYQYNYI
ncbi:hypothetical protein ABPG74_021143 [Tetrahymena malaccensis]